MIKKLIDVICKPEKLKLCLGFLILKYLSIWLPVLIHELVILVC